MEALNIEKYSIYLMDYGAPSGYRIAAKYPERVESLIIQNGGAYEEGLRKFWDPIKKFWNETRLKTARPWRDFTPPMD